VGVVVALARTPRALRIGRIGLHRLVMDRANGKKKWPHIRMQLIKEAEVVLQVRSAQQRMNGDIYVPAE